MTREKVSKRLEEMTKAKTTLENQIMQAQVQLNAFEGAIQDCTYWLQAIASEEAKGSHGISHPGAQQPIALTPDPPVEVTPK